MSHTFIATVEAISQAGAETEFVDIDERHLLHEPGGAGAYLAGCATDRGTGRPLGQRTGKPIKAIVPVHLYGQVADMDRFSRLPSEYDLLVVEDACQAQGASIAPAGEAGDARARSARRARSASILARTWAPAAKRVPSRPTTSRWRGRSGCCATTGRCRRSYHDLEGYNGRLDAIQAAFLRIKLRRLDAWNEQRRVAAARYHGLLADDPRSGCPFEPLARERSTTSTSSAPGSRAPGEHSERTAFTRDCTIRCPLHLQNCYHALGLPDGHPAGDRTRRQRRSCRCRCSPA